MSPETIKLFYFNFESLMSNLGRGRVKIKFRNSVLVQQNSSSLYSNFTLNLYIVYELNDWLYNPSHYFALKNCLLVTVKKKQKLNQK